MTQRLHVDWIRCRGRGICYELLPELLEADDWGYPLSRTGEPRPVVPARLQEDAEDAVRECPRMALRLLDEQEPARRRPVLPKRP
ncbi:MAG TPA: ferredoxin [Jatrophihabitans sp.]|nr:ferredoxin [Jatrophihabitans sp.]